MNKLKDQTLDEIIKALPEGHNARKEWEQLIQDTWFLECLRSAGVDNWGGYDDAIEMYQELGESL